MGRILASEIVSRHLDDALGVSWERLGSVLGVSWERLGNVLGPSWNILKRLGSIFGSLGAVLEGFSFSYLSFVRTLRF